MKVAQFLEQYVSQSTFSLEEHIAMYGVDGEKEYMRTLLDMHFTEKVNEVIGELVGMYNNEGIDEQTINTILLGFHEQSVEALQD